MKIISGKVRQWLAGYLFILPNFIGFLIFTLFPVFASFVLSFCKWDLFSDYSFAGFENFVRLLGVHLENGRYVFNSSDFWKYAFNTLFFMLAIPVSMALSLILAMVMNQKFIGRVFYRTIFFLPSITAGVALYILWKWIYNPDYGLINTFLAQIGVRGPKWLASPFWAKPAIMIMGIWTGVGGYTMILYLAGLQGINLELYEAATIDGASGWQKFWAVTWPMLSPTTFFIFIMSCIGGLQGSFDAVWVMTGGGPAGSTTTISVYIYNNAYQYYKMGYAAAVAWFLFLIIFIVTIINWKYGGKVVHYE